MLNEPNQPDWINLRIDRRTWMRLAAYLRVIPARCRRIQERAIRIEHLADEIAMEREVLSDEAFAVSELLRIALGGSGTRDGGVDGGGVLPSFQPAHRLDVTPAKRSGLFDVRIDFDEQPFQIQEQLGEFLIYIARGKAGGPSGLIEYRTDGELLEYIKANSRSRDPRRYLSNIVNRLRTELRRAGHSSDLVQRNSHGVRFATRKPLA